MKADVTGKAVYISLSGEKDQSQSKRCMNATAMDYASSRGLGARPVRINRHGRV